MIPSTYNGFWLYFWMATLAISSLLFATITLIVAIKGGAELIAMFRHGHKKKPMPQ